MSSGPERARERDFERFLTFVDAVVAIAITLLVLPLVDLAGELGDGGSVADLIGDHLAKVLYIGTMAVSSFCVAGMALCIRRTPAIRGSGDGPDGIGATTAGATMLLALAISVAIPATSYFPLLLLLVADPIVARVRA